MTDLTKSMQLHDRATRGENLTQDELERLEQWYEEQDADEVAMLATHRLSTSSDLETIPTDLQKVLIQVRETVSRIESLHQQNANLREEIAALHKQLIAKAA